MADEIEAVDPAEVAAMERAAGMREPERVVVPPHPGIEPAIEALERDLEPGRGVHPAMAGPPPAGLTITVPMPIEIQQELAALRDDLRDLKRWVRHTMHLTMVLGHILRATNEETDKAKAMIDQADALIAQKGPPT